MKNIGDTEAFFAEEAPENSADPFFQLEKTFHRFSLNQCHKISR